MTEMNDLLDAVDLLTKPAKATVLQDVIRTRIAPDGRPVTDDNGDPVRDVKGTQKVTIEHEPLLDQLEAAITGTMSLIQGSSASLASARGVLDSEALYLFTRIASMISDWAYAAKVPRRDTLAGRLRAWYTAWTATPREDEVVAAHVKRLTGWAHQIEEKLDPADEKILPDPCPEPGCTQGYDPLTGRWLWWDSRLGDAVLNPLVIRFRRTDGPEMVMKARARCRACGTTWTARGLQWELENRWITRTVTVHEKEVRIEGVVHGAYPDAGNVVEVGDDHETHIAYTIRIKRPQNTPS